MNRIYLQSWTTSGRNCALNNAIVERSNHVARVLIFESGCDTRIDLESAESRSSRDCDRCTVDALCSRGVPAGPWERSPSHRLNVACVRQRSTITIPLRHTLLSAFYFAPSLSFSVALSSFAPFHRTLVPCTYIYSLPNAVFLMYLRTCSQGSYADACLRAHTIHAVYEILCTYTKLGNYTRMQRTCMNGYTIYGRQISNRHIW